MQPDLSISIRLGPEATRRLSQDRLAGRVHHAAIVQRQDIDAVRAVTGEEAFV
jgi:hypothetical protein